MLKHEHLSCPSGSEGGLLRTEANTLDTFQMLKHLSCPSGSKKGLLRTEANTLGTLQMLKYLSCPSESKKVLLRTEIFSAVASLLHQPTALSSALALLYAVIYLQGVSLLRVCTKLCLSDGQVIFPGTCVFSPTFALGTNHLISGGVGGGGASTFRRGRKIFGRLLGGRK